MQRGKKSMITPKIRLRPGLHPGLRWGSLQRSPDPIASRGGAEERKCSITRIFIADGLNTTSKYSPSVHVSADSQINTARGAVLFSVFLGCGISWRLYIVVYRRSGVAVSNRYGSGSGTIWLDELQCTGEETSLAACRHNGWNDHDCNHDEDVSIVCNVSSTCKCWQTVLFCFSQTSF